MTDQMLLITTYTIKAIIRVLPASHESVGVSCIDFVTSVVVFTDVADKDKREK